jgi:CDP-diacylglycerol--glycerol-3-phosphate 3-phosphatidyltransferase
MDHKTITTSFSDALPAAVIAQQAGAAGPHAEATLSGARSRRDGTDIVVTLWRADAGRGPRWESIVELVRAMGEMAKFLSVSGRATAAKLLDPLAVRLVRMGLSANVVTVVGTIGVVAASVFLLARGEILWAVIAVTLAAATDLIDGAMARAKGDNGRFGAMLDSTMDRLADGAIFGALVFWLADIGDRPTMVAALIGLVSAQVVSYAKARAEGLGVRCDIGIAERAERLVLLGVAGLLHVFGVPYGLPVTLWVLAALSLVTIGQRLWYVKRELDGAAS